jgi:hypothetical protein
MAQISRKGYAQVEPNHLSAQKTGQIYAQLPAMGGNNHATPIAHLEQGQFLKYNYAANCASLDGDGEYMLVYCEEKLYDERDQMHKDFCLNAADFTDGKIYPRLFKTNVGDIYTTNAFGGAASSNTASVAGIALAEGNKLEVDSATGYLKAAGNTPAAPVFQVVKVYTMPDGQPGVKIQRIE